MSVVIKPLSETFEKSEQPLDTLLELNENVPSEIFDRPCEEGDFEEISPRIFGLKDVLEPLTVKSLNNAIYELGVVNLCWPEITEPVFETRTCFPTSYYTNTTKERLLLAYAENFRRQYHFHYKVRKPLLLQAPNECGLQKMVCTSIRPTKLCFSDTTKWNGIATLVSDYFDYEPLSKPMLHKSMTTQTTSAKARKRPADGEPENDAVLQLLREIITKTAERDDAAIFGDFIASKLRKMDSQTMCSVQHQIHNLIYETEMKSDTIDVD